MADRSVIVSEGSDIDANFGEKDVDLGDFPRGNNGEIILATRILRQFGE